ncbi:hypothetical protein SAMN05518801_105205 [Novosphingobium sp. CF614]|uniref:hypothetical protein n=1 Tax=Novosphingobium sp. CF614 TaxID=1884364 RepID=UPI0008DEFAF2|nr:hypothetical protein [Novosphingobium sp. CF614]SFG01736.1 hypothetical protein SAMN05518801_105205 [Novosphingobium sp. CF614]
MNDIPSTIHDGGGFPTGFGWNDSAELHKCEDGGGLFHRFKTIRRGTVADLIQFVMGLPEDRQPDYAIQKDGDHRLTIGEIRNLARRADFPRNDG